MSDDDVRRVDGLPGSGVRWSWPAADPVTARHDAESRALADARARDASLPAGDAVDEAVRAADRSVAVEWGWSHGEGRPVVAVSGEAHALDLAHRHDGSLVWCRVVGPWVRRGGGGG